MKFVDQVSIHVKAGDGGNGAVAFRREKFIEHGGPSGGDGGNGGSVRLVADPQLTTLLDYRYQPLQHAAGGQHGMGSDCNGRSAEDLVLRVPAGTLVKDAHTSELLADLSTPGAELVAAKGGRGGLGNMNFATSTRQAPRFAQEGTLGEERDLVLELKLLADVGLLGFPNAGKSSLIARVSRARPKVADYPFTTLVPNLGMVAYKDGLSFVMADIPGLIEGAADGAGLGHQFLRHLKRTGLLLHIVDLAPFDTEVDPVREARAIVRELERYDAELADKPRWLVLNKLDMVPEAERQPRIDDFVKRFGWKGSVHAISALTHEGCEALARDIYTELVRRREAERPPVTQAETSAEDEAPPAEFDPGDPRFRVDEH